MKKNKGITLIALIITIIIMLILVAVSVNVLIKSNLIGTAEKTVDKYKTASEEEADDGTIIINGKRYTSMAEYAEILDNGGSRIKFNHTVEGRTIKLNVKVIEQSYVEFAEKKLQNKSNKDKIKILSQGLEFWNGYGQVPYKNADEMLNDSPYDSWEQAVNMEENFDQLLINWGLVYPESYFNEDNNYVVFAKKKLETAKDDAEKQKLFLDGENYYRKENGEEPYKDLTELLTEWNYESVEKLVEGEGFESLDRMLIEFGDINPEKISEIEENNILALTLPNGEIETTPDNEYYTEYNANNVDIANYTFIAKKGQEENTLTVKMAVANLPGGTRVTKTTEYKYEDETAIIPAGFTVSGIGNEGTIDGGLVIYDIPEADLKNAGEDFWTKTTTVGTESYPIVQCNYNQFVWVPVETPYVTKAELDKIIADSNGSITTEREAMQSLADSGKYPMAVELANGTDYRGILYEFSEGTDKVNITVMDFSTTANYDDGSVTYNREPAKLSSTNSKAVNQTEEQKLDLQTEYNNIVKSVKEQNGFWVARYELSYNTKGESKRGKPVANASDSATYKWYGLYNACKTVYQAEMQSNMIYGSQWDQIMIWMKVVKNIKNSSKYYILDSSYMGNYDTESGGTEKRQVSGYKNEYSVKQIFDLGGNLRDWTTAANDTYSRVLQGGDFLYNTSRVPASSRVISNPEFYR